MKKLTSKGKLKDLPCLYLLTFLKQPIYIESIDIFNKDKHFEKHLDNLCNVMKKQDEEHKELRNDKAVIVKCRTEN